MQSVDRFLFHFRKEQKATGAWLAVPCPSEREARTGAFLKLTWRRREGVEPSVRLAPDHAVLKTGRTACPSFRGVVLRTRSGAQILNVYRRFSKCLRYVPRPEASQRRFWARDQTETAVVHIDACKLRHQRKLSVPYHRTCRTGHGHGLGLGLGLEFGRDGRGTLIERTTTHHAEQILSATRRRHPRPQT